MGNYADINYRQYVSDDGRIFESENACGMMYGPFREKENAKVKAEQDARSQSTQEIRDRNVTTALADRATGNAAYQAARNQGLTGAEAQAIKGQAENITRGNATNIGSALRSTGQSTQNDYLQKMGYANGLNQQASNLEAGSFLTTLGGIFGGAGQGAAVGASIGGAGTGKASIGGTK